jgi:uncharacterized protein YciI
MVFHVIPELASDYVERRKPFREAHLSRLLDLRARGLVVAVGPRARESRADMFYRVQSREEAERLVTEDIYFREKVWVGYEPRPFTQFVEPWGPAEPKPDGSRIATLVEGPAKESDVAGIVMVELRGKGRMTFGGFLGHRALLAMATPDRATAMDWVTETGLWTLQELTAWEWIFIL